MAWSWSTSLVAKVEEGDTPAWRTLLISLTFLLYVGALVISSLLYVYYTKKSGCGLNVFFVTFNLILAVFISVFSVLPKIQEVNPSSGILPAAVLAVYLAYIVGSAISSEPNNADFSCSPADFNAQDTAMMRAIKFIGIIFTFFALGYQAFGTGSTEFSSDEKDDEVEETQYNYAWFHVVYALAGLYMAAIITNWARVGQLDPNTSSNAVYVDFGFPAMWIKIVTSWICYSLYLWTLAAPVMFPDRDFGV